MERQKLPEVVSIKVLCCQTGGILQEYQKKKQPRNNFG